VVVGKKAPGISSRDIKWSKGWCPSYVTCYRLCDVNGSMVDVWVMRFEAEFDIITIYGFVPDYTVS
jgi:hypothetical protein